MNTIEEIQHSRRVRDKKETPILKRKKTAADKIEDLKFNMSVQATEDEYFMQLFKEAGDVA